MSLAPDSWTYPEREVRVYARRQKLSETLPTDWDPENWTLDTSLRCDQVRHVIGPNPATIALRYVPAGGVEPIETMVGKYSVNDQVKVVVVQPAAGEDPEVEITRFEGFITRIHIGAEGDEAGEREELSLTAFSAPWHDNKIMAHQVRGRWLRYGTGAGEIFVVEDRTLPAVFNFRGRPNMHASDTFDSATWDYLTDCPLWTHDDDEDGEYWTVRDALRSTIAMWLYGHDGAWPLDRHVDLDPELLNALDSGPGSDARFAGFDDQLPEVPIDAGGVFDALEAICQAAGFQLFFTLESNIGGGAGYGDRPYLLHITRKHTGYQVALNLADRGTAYTVPATFHGANDINKIKLTADGEAMRAAIRGRGCAMVECRIPLLPGWKASDLSLAAIDQVRRVDDPANETTYQARHVVGGSQFSTYGHAGRKWIVDCVGGFDGYAASPYQHVAAGFDWVAHLGLATGTPAPVAQRTTDGVDDTIRWTKRVRPLQPLHSLAARSAGIEFYLEVSEDAGSTWATCCGALPGGKLQVQTLRDECGIMLGIDNPACVNNAFYQTGEPPAIADSWMQLISDKQLLFRIHACVVADHGYVAEAPKQASCFSAYDYGQVVITDHQETWVHPNSTFNSTGTTWERTTDWARSAPGAGATSSLLDVCERRRDRLECFQIAGAGHYDILHIGKWCLGDVVTAIAGRDISLAANVGAVLRYPSIVAITENLSVDENGNHQSIRIELDDQRQTQGAYGLPGRRRSRGRGGRR